MKSAEPTLQQELGTDEEYNAPEEAGVIVPFQMEVVGGSVRFIKCVDVKRAR